MSAMHVAGANKELVVDRVASVEDTGMDLVAKLGSAAEGKSSGGMKNSIGDGEGDSGHLHWVWHSNWELSNGVDGSVEWEPSNCYANQTGHCY